MKRLAVILVVGFLAAFLVGCGSTSGSSASTSTGTVQDDTGGSGDLIQDDTTPAASPTATTSGWVKVFTWKGGGKSNFIRNSKKFTLNGGNQRIDTIVKPIKYEYSSPSADWYIQSENDGDQISTNKKTDSLDFYLSAGEYYIDSNTMDCYWTLTVYEER